MPATRLLRILAAVGTLAFLSVGFLPIPTALADLMADVGRTAGDDCGDNRSFGITEDGRVGTIRVSKSGSTYTHEFMLTQQDGVTPEFTNAGGLSGAGADCPSFVGQPQYLGDNQWVRVTGGDGSHCVVETSADGGGTWSAITTQPSSGTSCNSAANDYRFFAADDDTWVIVGQITGTGVWYWLTNDGGATTWFEDQVHTATFVIGSITPLFQAASGTIQFSGRTSTVPYVCIITGGAGDTCTAGTGLEDAGATSNTEIVCLDPIEDDYLACTDFKQYKVSTIDGVGAGTFDLALFRRDDAITGPWTFEERLTFGEDQAAATYQTRLSADPTHHRLFISYVDADPTPDQRVFAEYIVATQGVAGCPNEVGAPCQDYFESASIGAPSDFNAAVTEDGTLVGVGYDSTQSAATGQSAVYRIDLSTFGQAVYPYIEVQSILGMDVDISGTNLIVKHEGDKVSTYGAQSMTGPIATLEPACSGGDGVMAAQLNVGYTVCVQPGNDEVDMLVVNTPDLDGSSDHADCGDDADYVEWDFQQGGESDVIRRVKTFEFFSIDYEFAVDEGIPGCVVQAAFAFTTDDGQVGFAAIAVFGSGDSDISTDAVRNNPSDDGPVLDLCVAQDLEAVEQAELGVWLIAVQADNPTKTYRVANADIELARVGSGPLGDALAVACGVTDRSLLVTLDQVYGYNHRSGSTAWSIPTTGGYVRGAAQSWDGEWGAYADDDHINIVNMTTGNITGTRDLPQGFLRQIEMDSTGQAIWVWMDDLSSSTDRIYKIEDVYLNTTVTPVAPGDKTPGVDDPFECEPDCPEEDSTDECDSPFCVSAANVPDGFTAAALNGFLGLLFVGMVTVGGVGAMQQASPGFRAVGIAVVLFATIGYLIGVFLGFLPVWPIVVAVIGAIVMLHFKIRSG